MCVDRFTGVLPLEVLFPRGGNLEIKPAARLQEPGRVEPTSAVKCLCLLLGKFPLLSGLVIFLPMEMSFYACGELDAVWLKGMLWLMWG